MKVKSESEMSFTQQIPSSGSFSLNNLTVNDGAFVTLSIPSSTTQTMLVPNSGSVTIYAGNNYNTQYSTTFTSNYIDMSAYGGSYPGPLSWKVGANTVAIFYSQRGFLGSTITYGPLSNIPQAPGTYLSCRIFSYQSITSTVTNYINNIPYSFSPTTLSAPTASFTYWYPIDTATDLGTETRTITTSTSQQSFVSGSSVASNDVMASPTTAYYAREWSCANPTFSPDSSARDERDPVQSYNFTTGSVGTTTANQMLLCLEMHGNYLAFRTVAGLYLHMLPSAQATNSTYSGQIETVSDYVLTFSNLPSALHSAQWAIYTQTSSTSVVLLNRATQTCLTMDNGNPQVVSGAYYSSGNQPYDYVFEYASTYTWRDSFCTQYCQSWDQYYQNFFRMLGTTPIATALTSSACIFTLTVVAQKTCDLTNPNAVCLDNYTSDVAAAFESLCGSADMASTPNCTAWALGKGNADAQATVAAYCAKYPNDQSLCGCTSLYAVRELQDFLSYNAPPIVLQPNCNVPTCVQNISYFSPSLKTCVQIICTQTLLVLGNVTNSSLSFAASCANSVNTGSGAVDATTDVLGAVITQIQTYITSAYNNALSHITVMSVVISLVVAVIIVFILTLVLKLSTFLIVPTLLVASVTTFLVFFNQ